MHNNNTSNASNKFSSTINSSPKRVKKKRFSPQHQFLNNPTRKTKWYAGSYQMAKEAGLLTEFVFYTGLKSIKINGYISKGTEIKDALERIYITLKGKCCKESNLYTILDKIVKAGYIRKEKNGYQLVKYDIVWNDLFKKTGKIRPEKNSIYRIQFDEFTIDKYVRNVASGLIKKQQYTVSKSKLPRVNKLLKAIGNCTDQKIDKLNSFYDYRDITLSNITLAHEMGYKSERKGAQLFKENHYLNKEPVRKLEITLDHLCSYDMYYLKDELYKQVTNVSSKYVNNVPYTVDAEHKSICFYKPGILHILNDDFVEQTEYKNR